MATKAFYDGPGVYDEPYQVKEARNVLFEMMRVLQGNPTKLRVIDGLVADLTARRARIVAGTETNEEKFGPQDTILASGPITTLPPTRPI